MQFQFQNKELKKLYETGKSRKYKLPEQIIDKFIMRIDSIIAAETIHDLWQNKALNFEKLTNTDIYSMRLNNKYRLEMKIEWENKIQTIGEFFITDISLHYGD